LETVHLERIIDNGFDDLDRLAPQLSNDYLPPELINADKPQVPLPNHQSYSEESEQT